MVACFFMNFLGTFTHNISNFLNSLYFMKMCTQINLWYCISRNYKEIHNLRKLVTTNCNESIVHHNVYNPILIYLYILMCIACGNLSFWLQFFEVLCWMLPKNLDKKWILLYFRRHDDAADEEGHTDGGTDSVLYLRDSVSHRLYTQPWLYP